uniref:Uncharacterized protein n=1 Tax=Vespula pensylvanica TaxID=30213 RepID=A0A834P2J3_VESPE|nr:hypothetical protein H0235_008146 [Vespula pensylvanica]
MRRKGWKAATQQSKACRATAVAWPSRHILEFGRDRDPRPKAARSASKAVLEDIPIVARRIFRLISTFRAHFQRLLVRRCGGGVIEGGSLGREEDR